jgi:hypothetical protein
LAKAYGQAVGAIQQISQAPWDYSEAAQAPFTDVAGAQNEALDKLLQLTLMARLAAASVATATNTLDREAESTLKAIETVVMPCLAYLRQPSNDAGTAIRRAETDWERHDPEQGDVQALVTLARHVSQAVHPKLSKARAGEAQLLVRVWLPRLGGRLAVAEEDALSLLNSWAPRSTRGKRTIAGIVRELAVQSGIVSVSRRPEGARALAKTVSVALARAGITNKPERHFLRRDGSYVGRSFSIVAEELSFAPLPT